MEQSKKNNARLLDIAKNKVANKFAYSIYTGMDICIKTVDTIMSPALLESIQKAITNIRDCGAEYHNCELVFCQGWFIGRNCRCDRNKMLREKPQTGVLKCRGNCGNICNCTVCETVNWTIVDICGECSMPSAWKNTEMVESKEGIDGSDNE